MEKNKATVVLIALNVIVFVWQMIELGSVMMGSPAAQFAIMKFGANLNPLVLDGQYWRLLTSMFLHVGIIHLLSNMYGLYAIGWNLEEAIGSWRFVLVYMICGIAAGLTSLGVNVFTSSVGASGAVFGVYGYALMAEIIAVGRDREKLMPILSNFGIFLLANLLITNVFAVDLAGHIGGMIAGVVLALFHFKLRILSGHMALLIILIVLPCSMIVFPKEQLRYHKLFKELVEIDRDENKYLANYTSDNALRDSLFIIKERWDSLEARSKSMSFIQNKELAQDTALFKQRVSLQKDQTFFRLKVLDQSYIYLDSIEFMFAQFDSLPSFVFKPYYDYVPQQAPPEEQERKSGGPVYRQARVFYDSLWRETDDPVQHVYYRIGMRDSIGRWQGPVRDYYRGGKLQMKGSYSDNRKDGVFIYYSDHDTYQSAGRYKNEIAVGKWEEFHWNGVLKEVTFYDGRGFTKNVWDSLGRTQVENGMGKVTRWHLNGVVAEEGDYMNGRRNGMWKGFHEDGSPYYEEMYRDNELIRGVSVTKDGRRFVYDETSQYPVPEGGMQAFRRFELLNKKKEFSWSGTVKVVFDVASDGTMGDFTILDSSCLECNAEAIRLVKEGPRWLPGVAHGHRKVSGRGYVEIQF